MLQQLTLESAIDDFLLSQRASRNSPRTIHYYTWTLSRFSKFCSGSGVNTLDQISAQVIRRYIVSLQEAMKPNSVHTLIRAVRALLCYLEREEAIDKNPMKKVKMPSIDKVLLPAFTDEELQKLLAATDGSHWLNQRDKALILFLLDSGLRLHECEMMNVIDLDFATGVFKVLGKGRKERICKVSCKTLLAIKRYLRNRPSDSRKLWIGARGPLKLWGITNVVRDLGTRAGVHAHPHKFRRTCALKLLRAGCDVFSVQFLMGHSDLSVLRKYLAQTECDLIGAHERYSPVMALGR